MNEQHPINDHDDQDDVSGFGLGKSAELPTPQLRGPLDLLGGGSKPIVPRATIRRRGAADDSV